MEHLNLSLGQVKRFKNRSHKSLYFRAQLLRDGRIVADVTNDGKGDENNYFWRDNISMMEINQYADQRFPQFFKCQKDALIDTLLEEQQRNNDLKQKCKKKLIFRLKGDKVGEYRTLNVGYSATSKAWLTERHGEIIEEIINERFRKT